MLSTDPERPQEFSALLYTLLFGEGSDNPFRIQPNLARFRSMTESAIGGLLVVA